MPETEHTQEDMFSPAIATCHTIIATLIMTVSFSKKRQLLRFILWSLPHCRAVA